MTIIAGIIWLGCASVVVLGAFFWILDARRSAKASKIHRQALEHCSTEEIRSRAMEWVAPEWKAPRLLELKRNLADSDYRVILKRWRGHAAALEREAEWDVEKEGPLPTWILKDYVSVLAARGGARTDRA